jgi:hypothetical protein
MSNETPHIATGDWSWEAISTSRCENGQGAENPFKIEKSDHLVKLWQDIENKSQFNFDGSGHILNNIRK